MGSSIQFNVRSKQFAIRIAMMIQTRLISYKHYYGWADALIEELDDAPIWVLEIATIKYYPDALAAIYRFANSEPFESFDRDRYAYEGIACFFLRYKSREISWATFLYEAGMFTDTNDAGPDCDYFFMFLNELEDHEYAENIEMRQRSEIESRFSAAISTIRPVHEKFMSYFREYVVK